MDSEVPANVLLVSPDVNMLERLSNALPGYVCLTATSEKRALELLAERSFHVAVADDALFHSSMRFMRLAWAASPWTEFVVLSDPIVEAATAKGAAEAASMYLHKPVSASELRQAVEKTLERIALASSVFRIKGCGA